MPSSTTVERFIAHDLNFLEATRSARDSDPLQVRGSGMLRAFQGLKTAEVSESVVAEVMAAHDQWRSENPSPGVAEITAAKRDLDRVFGHYVISRQPLPDSLAERIPAIAELTAPIITPRANFYDYSVGSAATIEDTYTGDEREINLIKLFGRSIDAAHLALHGILRGRDAAAAGDQAKVQDLLEQSLDHIKAMHQPMIEVYREVGPAFVAQEVTRFLGPLKINGERYEGPNPSHSGYMALDRFIYGSFESMYQEQPFLRQQFAFRRQDMPRHLVEVIDEADRSHDDSSLVELCEEKAPNSVSLAQEIGIRNRKFKVVHKSYADKGLVAKGGELTPEEPDVLSEAVRFARRNEK